jgi:toluene monooxygenase system protein A
MLNREDWLHLARKLDWNFSYVKEEDVYPKMVSGSPWLKHSEWSEWDEPFKTTFSEYVANQQTKEASVYAVQEALGKVKDLKKLSPAWVNALKLHAATLPLAEFAAVIGNLRAARFGRDSAWRTMATFGALDECRHTQIPLLLMHELVKWDQQFDWTHKFYHTNNWVAIAARHAFDEVLLAANAIEFAIATNFVFETGFTNVQFIGLSELAHNTGDKLFEKMITSIQTDEARHAQIGPPVLKKIVEHDKKYAQYLLDKWFWRSWRLFAIVTGFVMDYLTPVEHRTQSFKEFMQEWVVDQYLSQLKEYGLEKPWYWETFLTELENYHHMVYASAYTYRATVWFNFVLPGPRERTWLQYKYPDTWAKYDPIWEQITEEWKTSDVGNDFSVHGTSIVGFCDMCQVVLCGGTPEKNTAVTYVHDGKKYIFCSEPCHWIFKEEPERYASHKDVVKRVLAGEAPPNLIAMLRRYFNLEYESWGKDAFNGNYSWINRSQK